MVRSPTRRPNSRISFGSERSRRSAQVGHQQVVVDQEDHPLDWRLGSRAQPLQARLRPLHAPSSSGPAEALADVVEQAAQVDNGHPIVSDASHQLREPGKAPSRSRPSRAGAALRPGRSSAHPPCRCDTSRAASGRRCVPLGQEGAEQPDLVHRHQGRASPDALIRGSAKKSGPRLRGTSGRRRRSGEEVLAHQALRLAGQRHIVILGHREGQQEQDRGASRRSWSRGGSRAGRRRCGNPPSDDLGAHDFDAARPSRARSTLFDRSAIE